MTADDGPALDAHLARLRRDYDEREPAAIAVVVAAVDLRALLDAYDEAMRTRTLGGPVTGRRISAPPGRWANVTQGTPELATPALAAYEHPDRTATGEDDPR